MSDGYAEVSQPVNKRKLKKLVKDVILELIEEGIKHIEGNNKPPTISSPPSKITLDTPLFETVTCYGLLINSTTKQKDLILEARSQSIENTRLAFYMVANNQLFTTFPAAANYITPYVGQAKVFLEVVAKVDNFYMCKPVDNLRYLELLKKEEING